MTDTTAFARIDAMPGNTLLVFDSIATADDYVVHRSLRGDVGVICRVEDMRTGSGLLVQWRDPIPEAEFARRQGEARWLLEEVLAGRAPRPQPGAVTDISPDVEARRVASLQRRAAMSRMYQVDPTHSVPIAYMTPDELLAAVEKHKLSICPQVGGGWVIEVSNAADDPSEIELARTRTDLISSIREALGDLARL